MARLPPFIALRALEAAARHQSYSRAAEELHVTHGAVSHQIRRLEEDLGTTLFLRHGNTMQPTPPALKLAGRIAGALDLLHTAIEEVSADAVADPLVLSAASSFAARWLTPRLSRLAGEAGEAHLEVRAADSLANFVTDGVDAAIRYGLGRWPGASATALFTETIFPVCSPAFAEKYQLKRPEDLLRAPLLRQNERPWSLWFAVHGLDAPTAKGGLIFDDSALLLEAAAQGLGVALARSGLVEGDLRAGRLVRPFEGEAPAEAGYHFVWRDDSRKLKRILRLRDWLVAESVGSEAQP